MFSCPASELVGNVTTSPSAQPPYSDGTVATFQCNKGYVLNGTGTRECSAIEGGWTGTNPTCVEENTGKTKFSLLT